MTPIRLVRDEFMIFLQGVFSSAENAFHERKQRGPARFEAAAMGQLQIRMEHLLVANLRRIKRWAKLAARHSHDFWPGKFQQSLRAAGHAETTAPAPAERQARIG